MKSDSVSAYVYMRRDTALPLYAPVHTLNYKNSEKNLYE